MHSSPVRLALGLFAHSSGSAASEGIALITASVSFSASTDA
jgi:hypothetical protein